MTRFPLLPMMLAATLLTAGVVRADEAKPEISVSGEGAVFVQPDIAELDLGVLSIAKTAQEALAANAKATQSVVAALKGAGIADKDMQTSSLALQPEFPPLSPSSQSTGIPAIVGYRAENSITITVRDVAQTGDLLDKATANGANSNVGIGFRVSNPAYPLDEARQAAVADAKHKAEIYAAAAGLKLGPLISLSDNLGAPQPGVVNYAFKGAAQMRLPVMQGQAEISAHVTARFALVAP
ncbi:SIMPL domain-containing protein [Methylovirgula sp. 4M-Z18]|uniref:SIMPL domain-containing protein n=1 Tax=Methylovirgula sp. 4M-Z18 TaxID=2293567 RepID=UPI0013148D9B|nr:SIMPL domain-containing protein [Methylovirgula sp. 4M-Z18]